MVLEKYPEAMSDFETVSQLLFLFIQILVLLINSVLESFIMAHCNFTVLLVIDQVCWPSVKLTSFDTVLVFHSGQSARLFAVVTHRSLLLSVTDLR